LLGPAARRACFGAGHAEEKRIAPPRLPECALVAVRRACSAWPVAKKTGELTRARERGGRPEGLVGPGNSTCRRRDALLIPPSRPPCPSTPAPSRPSEPRPTRPIHISASRPAERPFRDAAFDAVVPCLSRRLHLFRLPPCALLENRMDRERLTRHPPAVENRESFPPPGSPGGSGLLFCRNVRDGNAGAAAGCASRCSSGADTSSRAPSSDRSLSSTNGCVQANRWPSTQVFRSGGRLRT